MTRNRYTNVADNKHWRLTDDWPKMQPLEKVFGRAITRGRIKHLWHSKCILMSIIYARTGCLNILIFLVTESNATISTLVPCGSFQFFLDSFLSPLSSNSSIIISNNSWAPSSTDNFSKIYPTSRWLISFDPNPAACAFIRYIPVPSTNHKYPPRTLSSFDFSASLRINTLDKSKTELSGRTLPLEYS